MNKSQMYMLVTPVVVVLASLVYLVIELTVQTNELKARLDSIKSPVAFNPSIRSSTFRFSREPSTELDQRVEKLSSQIAILQQEISGIVSQIEVFRFPTSPMSSEELTLHKLDTMRSDREQEIDEQSRVREARIRRELDQFNSESVDQAWSLQMHGVLHQSFSDTTLDGAELTYSDCRETRCELSWKVDHDLSDLQKFELDNNIFIETARLGLESAVFLESAGNGEYRAIFRKN